MTKDIAGATDSLLAFTNVLSTRPARCWSLLQTKTTDETEAFRACLCVHFAVWPTGVIQVPSL